MKIASIILESILKAGGYEIFTYNLLSAFVDKGHDVTLFITEREYRKKGQYYTQMPFKVRPLPWNFPSILKHCPPLAHFLVRRLQDKMNFDIWQVMGAYPEGWAVSGLEGRVPLVLRAHGDDIQAVPEIGYGMRLDPRIDTRIRKTLPKMDTVVALTRSIVDEITELGTPPERVAVIPNGIDLSQFTRNRDIATIREKRGFTKDDFVLLTIGRNHPKKGFDLIPEIAQALLAKGLRFKWLVLGKDCEALEPAIRDRQLSDVLKTAQSISPGKDPAAITRGDFPPEELIEIYAMADLFVFPSRIETFGRVLIESMAAHTPVVTTDCLGCRDVVEMGRHGKMVPVDDVERMVEAIESVIIDKNELNKLAKNGFARATEFDWDIVAETYLEKYRDLTGRT